MTEELEVIDKAADWTAFLKDCCRDRIKKLERTYPKTLSIEIEVDLLEKYGHAGKVLADDLLMHPEVCISDIKDALRQSQMFSIRNDYGADITSDVIDALHIRFVHLPKKTRIRDIRAEQINTFISVEGLVRRASEVRPRLTVGAFVCDAGHITMMKQKYEQFTKPAKCRNAECRLTPNELNQELSTFTNSQLIRIQETPEGLRGGEQPQTLDVSCTDDICGKVMPGDRVTVNGILKSIPRPTTGIKSPVFDIYLECSSIEISVKEFEDVSITEEDVKQIRELADDPEILTRIAKSIAPTIYGNEDVKKAIALQLFGGVTKELPDGVTLRGDFHILLVGDPGIAKSQLLRYVIKLAPRGIYTSGKSASSAGLTAAAVKDELEGGRWTLEAGALVLADKGMAAVDEMDKMQKEDRSSLHEAMEQQSITVAKAGISATLKTRCSLLGAANPKLGRFDDYIPLAEQINMPPSLLSRFDLIFIMKDKPDETRDRELSRHILRSHVAGEECMYRQKYSGFTDEPVRKPAEADISPGLLRKYLAYAKQNCIPRLSPETEKLFEDYFMKLRSSAYEKEKENNEQVPVPVTARQLEALVRLGEASARMRLSDTVEAEDARRVIAIVNTSLMQVAVDPATGRMDADRVASSTTQTARTIYRDMKEAIRELSIYPTGPGGSSMAAKIDDVCQNLENRGYPKQKCEEMLEKLRLSGEVLLPMKHLVRLI